MRSVASDAVSLRASERSYVLWGVSWGGAASERGLREAAGGRHMATSFGASPRAGRRAFLGRGGERSWGGAASERGLREAAGGRHIATDAVSLRPSERSFRPSATTRSARERLGGFFLIYFKQYTII
jgi:predicted transcriptional regulator